MKQNACLVLALGLILGTVAQMRAQTLTELPLTIQLSDQTKRTSREKSPDGTLTEKSEVKFTVSLHNNSSKEPLGNIRLRLIPFFIPYDFETKDYGHQPGTVQTRDNISLTPSETLAVKFDPEAFEKSESKDRASSSTATLVTITHGGKEYAGVALEIYIGDKLVSTRFNGNSLVRKAYENWNASNPAESTPAPKK
jgi:hypothetical protein